MRSHSIAGWGSRKSRRILLFPSNTHSGWNYGCRRWSTDFTTVGLSTAAGDGFAVFEAKSTETNRIPKATSRQAKMDRVITRLPLLAHGVDQLEHLISGIHHA